MPIVRRASSTNASNDFSSQTNGLVLIKHDRNDPYMVFFKTCSNSSGSLHI